MLIPIPVFRSKSAGDADEGMHRQQAPRIGTNRRCWRTMELFFLFFLMSALYLPAARADEAKPWWPSKYGAGDQTGSLHEITPERIVGAAKLVKTGKVYDMGRVVHENIPRFPGRFWHQTIVADSIPKSKNQIAWITEMVTGTYQIGTQLDALAHLMIGGRFYNGFRKDEIVGEKGAAKLGVETIPPIVTRGVLIDLTEDREEGRLSAGEVVTPARIEDFLAKHKLELARGDALLFHTGWGSLWEKPAEFVKGEPGLGLEAAEWLAQKGIAVTGCDTWSFGPVPSENSERPFEVPQTLNVKHGVFILENLKTEELARDKVFEFLFVVTHAKTKGSTASQVSPAAIV